MYRSYICLLGFSFSFILNLFAASTVAAAQTKPASEPTYWRDIRPIIQNRCVVCHNRDTVAAAATSGGLDLDSYEAVKRGVLAGSAHRPIFTPGKLPTGTLIERLSTTSPSRMMPRGGPPLPPEQIALFKAWITDGAAEGTTTAPHALNAASITLPMPAPLGLRDVSFTTLVRAAGDLMPKPAPKDPAVELALKIGPAPAVTSLAYSPDGQFLAVGAYRAVTVWNTKTGKPAGCVSHLAGPVQTMAFRPDGSQLAIGGGLAGVGGEVRVVDTRTLAQVGPIIKGHTEVVLSLAWSTDGTRIATGSQDKTAKLWEWPSGKELKSFKDHGDAVTAVAFSPDCKSLYTASLDHNLRRYDVDKGTLTRTFAGHNEGVTAMAVNIDGKRLISSGTEPNLRWWDTETGDTTNNNGGHNAAVNQIVLSKDGKRLVSVSADKTVRIWDANSTGQQRQLDGSTDWVYTAAFSPDSKFTAAAGADGIVRIWETASGRLRLMLMSWPLEKSADPEWLAVAPEGFFDGSPDWCSMLRPEFADEKTAVTPQLAAWVKSLHQPESLAKSWQGLPLDPAKPK